MGLRVMFKAQKRPSQNSKVHKDVFLNSMIILVVFMCLAVQHCPDLFSSLPDVFSINFTGGTKMEL